MYSYTNGNTFVTLESDGTKIREWPDGEIPRPDHPESCDLKITNFCSGTEHHCMRHCHEKSNSKGLHCDPLVIENLVEGLPGGVELAIGGGNPLAHPDLKQILLFLRSKNIVPNLTVNAIHLSAYGDLIRTIRHESLIFGLGISLIAGYEKEVESFVDSNTVYHVIAGVHNVHDIRHLPKGSKILVLGYKQYGNGLAFYRKNPVEETLGAWRYWIGSLIQRFHISFDNLGLDQLRVKDIVPKALWDSSYMGDDGTFTMYVDAVTRSYASSSTKERIPLNGMSIREAFYNVRNSKK